MKLNKTSLIISLCLFGLLLSPIGAYAQPVTSFENPLDVPTNMSASTVVALMVGRVITFVVYLAAFIALLAIVIAGIRYILAAGGGEQEVAKAKQILLWSIIGLFIIGLALVILWAIRFILGIGGTLPLPTYFP